MKALITVDQPPLAEVTRLPWITEDVLATEPSLRRASLEFAYKYGGEIVRAAIDIADNSGELADNSVVMVQKSVFVPGFYPIQPEWHFDYTPGRTPTSDNATFEPAIYDSTGLVMCAFDINDHPNDTGTVFLQGGSVELDLETRRPGVGGRSKVNQQVSGQNNWYDAAVRSQIKEDGSTLLATSTRPNTLYSYTSRNLHFPSLMRSVGGTRAIVRINTPVDKTVGIKIKNTFYQPSDEPRSLFHEGEPGHWVRYTAA
jgi:hypothetical protein